MANLSARLLPTLTVTLSRPAWSQGALLDASAAKKGAPSISPQREKRIRRLLEVTGAAQIGLQSMDAILAQLSRTPNVPPGFLERVRERAKPEDLVDMIVPVYAAHLSADDVEGAIRFFESPAGQRLVKAQPAMVQEAAQLGAQWGERLVQQVAQEFEGEQQAAPKAATPPAKTPAK